MDSSKAVQGAEECSSSSESGWTMYINSPEKQYNQEEDDEEEEEEEVDDSVAQQGYKKKKNGDDDSDDSMASDASSGPSYQGNLHFSHAGNRDERNCMVGKEQNQQQEKKKKHEQKKAEKDKAAHSGARLKKF